MHGDGGRSGSITLQLLLLFDDHTSTRLLENYRQRSSFNNVLFRFKALFRSFNAWSLLNTESYARRRTTCPFLRPRLCNPVVHDHPASAEKCFSDHPCPNFNSQVYCRCQTNTLPRQSRGRLILTCSAFCIRVAIKCFGAFSGRFQQYYKFYQLYTVLASRCSIILSM